MNHLIIMAGGVGSRFWPMSTPEMPKQFIDILGIGKTLLQLTVDRFQGVIPIENVWVVTSKKYKDIVSEQLEGIPSEQILLEPCMRNTAPCIAYVSWKINARDPNANLVFSPADQIVLDVDTFRTIIRDGLDFIQDSNSILTLGIEPIRPETGYGYIKSMKSDDNTILKVESFKEKPSLEVAKEYMSEGTYYWNSGIFLWNVNTVMTSMRESKPGIAELFDRIVNSFYTPNEQNVIDEEFPNCENISIDYAIMEKSSNVYVYPSSFGWSDLGTWGSLYTHLERDANENAIVGNQVKMIDSKNCVVHTPEERRVVIQGLDNYIVAEKGNTLLICKKEEEQLIKEWSK